jgi:hypothetical protein
MKNGFLLCIRHWRWETGGEVVWQGGSGASSATGGRGRRGSGEGGGAQRQAVGGAEEELGGGGVVGGGAREEEDGGVTLSPYRVIGRPLSDFGFFSKSHPLSDKDQSPYVLKK